MEKSSIYKSTDAGNTWSSASTGLPDEAAEFTPLTIDPTTPRTLYTATWTSVGGAHRSFLLKSTDAGSTWSAATAGSGAKGAHDDTSVHP